MFTSGKNKTIEDTYPFVIYLDGVPTYHRVEFEIPAHYVLGGTKMQMQETRYEPRGVGVNRILEAFRRYRITDPFEMDDMLISRWVELFTFEEIQHAASVVDKLIYMRGHRADD